MARGRDCVTPPILSSSEDDMDDSVPNGESDLEDVTTSEIIARIMKAWQAEKLAPELLVPVEEELNALQHELVIMESNLRKLGPTDLRLSIHRMEVKRLRYIITSYLRLRLLKIQEYAWFYAYRLNQHQQQRSKELPFMMKNEMLFTREYLNNVDLFLKEVALDHMPANFQTFGETIRPQLRKPPNLERFVFIRSNMTADLNFLNGNNESETIELAHGEQYILPYKPLQAYVQSGEVTLL